MPRYPRISESVVATTGSAFSKLAHRLDSHDGEVYPLHVGDTWMEPADGCRMQDLRVEEYPGMHRYAPPRGLPELLEAVARRVTERSGLTTSADEVLVAAGATGALGAAVGAICAPGDEVLIVAPYWPLIEGIVRSFHGTPVPVPLLGEAASVDEALEALDRAAGERTVALYVNTPNNPTGRILPRAWLEGILSWAVERDLWILSDEVYEDYVYRGEHTYCRPLAPERTLAAHSFSKAYGMAGNRIGYLVGPADVVPQICKVSTHTFYSTPTASQLAVLRALEGPGDEWVRQARSKYRELGDDAAEALGVAPPEGSTFLFLDVAEALDDDGLGGFLERCVDRGLFVAPGRSFGPYPAHVRVCFTSAPPDVVRRGVGVLADLLAR